MKVNERVPAEISAVLQRCCDEHIRSASLHGLDLAPGMGQEAWSRVVSELARESGRNSRGGDSLIAWIGDVLAYAAGKYRGQICAYATAARVHPTTLRNAKMVCMRIPISRRRDGLSWSHHCEVAIAFEDHEAIELWLDRAEKESLSRGMLRRLIRTQKREALDSVPRREFMPDEGILLMRELRVVERLVRKHEATLERWQAAVCASALRDLPALTRFIAALGSRAQGLPAEC